MNVQDLETEELIILLNNIKFELEKRREVETTNIAQELFQKAERLGIPIEDILEELKRGGKRKRVASKPKYRNPNNPNETWSGIGRKPGWIIEYQERYNSLDGIAI